MGELADRLDAMRIKVTTPDHGLTAELIGRKHVILSIQPGLYRRINDSGMERKLANLAQILWVARSKEYRRVFNDVSGGSSAGDHRPSSQADIDWQEERDQLIAVGTSSDQRVTIRSTGMVRWTVSIEPGTLRALDEADFVKQVGEAGQELIRHQYTEMAALSYKHYGWKGPR